MPTEMIKEFIGKECIISLFGETGIKGKIISVEENWIKIEEKSKIRILNCDLVKYISLKK